MLTQSYIMQLRRSALRKNLFLRTLDCTERGILTLTCRLVKIAKSKLLVNILKDIINKLENAMKSRFSRIK